MGICPETILSRPDLAESRLSFLSKHIVPDERNNFFIFQLKKKISRKTFFDIKSSRQTSRSACHVKFVPGWCVNVRKHFA